MNLHNPALRDLWEGVAWTRLWTTLGWRDIRLRYRRTVFGPFWTTLTTAIFVAALGAVYSTLWKMEVREYLPYLSAGLISWNLFVTIVNESCGGFTTADEIIKSTRLPYSTFIYRILWRNFVVFAHNLTVHAAVLVIFEVRPQLSILLLPVGLLLIALNGVWIGFLLATVCARYRDVAQLVASALQVLFFVTPIFWQAELAGRYAPILAGWNPAYHLIEITRAPLLMRVPDLTSYLVVIAIGILGTAITARLVGRVHKRIPYWL